MEAVQNLSVSMEAVGGSSAASSLLSASIVDKFKKDLEKTGVVLIPEVEGMLRKCIDESDKELPPNSSSLTENVAAYTVRPVSEQLVEHAILPPLIYQFEVPKNGCVFTGMMINGKPEVLKNDEGSESTPALAAFTDEKGIVYGTEALKLVPPPTKVYSRQEPRPPKVWQCMKMQRPMFTNLQRYQHVNLKDFGIFNLPAQFFNAYLIRKLKITAESQCNGGLCQVAIMVVPMEIKCAQRVRLKEGAVLGGFKNVYLISAEGLSAYYWFTQKKEEMEENNYSKDIVIIDLFGNAVVYQKSIEAGIDGKEVLLVKAVILLDLFTRTEKEEQKFGDMIEKKLKIDQNKTVIPVIRENVDRSNTLYIGSNYRKRVRIVEDDDSDKFKYFAMKGAALLSENPENIGRQVRNKNGTTIMIGVEKKTIAWPNDLLPLNSTFSMKHDMPKYRIDQYGGIGGDWNKDHVMIGYLAINGVKFGSELEVSFELNSEGILKVVGVSARNPSGEDGESYKAVRWDLLVEDKVDIVQFGSNSYEECKLLLLKLAPSPPPQDKVVSRGMPEVSSSSTTGGFGNSQDEGVMTSSSTEADIGGQIGTQKKKGATKARVIRANDIIVNTALNKIQLESDWVAPVVKVEHDSMEGLEQGGNGQQQQEIVVKVENEDIVDQNPENTRKRKRTAKEKVSKSRKQQ